ncbi:MAG: hypothetical protein ACRC46_09970 [Thermoguttaceae bacterium]
MITLLLEQMWPWWVVAGGVAVAGVLALQRHGGVRVCIKAQLIAVAIAVAGYLVVTYVYTDNKAIRHFLTQAIAAVENDQPDQVTSLLSPRGRVLQSDVRETMSRVFIDRVRYLDLHFEVNRNVTPPTAKVDFDAFVQWRPKPEFKREVMLDLGDRELLHRTDVVLTLEKSGRTWLLLDATFQQ